MDRAHTVSPRAALGRDDLVNGIANEMHAGPVFDGDTRGDFTGGQ